MSTPCPTSSSQAKSAESGGGSSSAGSRSASKFLPVARETASASAVSSSEADSRGAALLDQGADLVGMRPVADQVSPAVDVVDPELLDPRKRSLERRQVAVDVGDDGGGLHQLLVMAMRPSTISAPVERPPRTPTAL